jgi:hypothetical protein
MLLGVLVSRYLQEVITAYNFILGLTLSLRIVYPQNWLKRLCLA